MKKVHLEPWGAFDKLCLVSTMYKLKQTIGDQNWAAISRHTRQLYETVGSLIEYEKRSDDWFSIKQCAAQYEALLKTLGPRKKRRGERHPDNAELLDILETNLKQDLAEELKASLAAMRKDYMRSKQIVDDIDNNKFDDDRLEELLMECEDKAVDIRSKLKSMLDEKNAESDVTTKPSPPVITLASSDNPEQKNDSKPSSTTSPLLTSLLQSPSPLVRSSIPSASSPTISLLLHSSPPVPITDCTLSKLLETSANIQPVSPSNVTATLELPSSSGNQQTSLTFKTVSEEQTLLIENVDTEKIEEGKIIVEDMTDVEHDVVESEIIIEQQASPNVKKRRLDLEVEDDETEEDVMETVEEIIERVEEAIIETVGENNLEELDLAQSDEPTITIDGDIGQLEIGQEQTVEVIVLGTSQDIVDDSSHLLNNEAVIISGPSVKISNDTVVINDTPLKIGEDTVVINDAPVKITEDTVIINDSSLKINEDTVVISDSTVAINEELGDSPSKISGDIIVLEEPPTEISEGSIILGDSHSKISGDIIVLEESPSKSSGDIIVLEESPSKSSSEIIVLEESPSKSSGDIIVLEESPSKSSGDIIVLEETHSKNSGSIIVLNESPSKSSESIISDEFPSKSCESIISDDSPSKMIDDSILIDSSSKSSGSIISIDSPTKTIAETSFSVSPSKSTETVISIQNSSTSTISPDLTDDDTSSNLLEEALSNIGTPVAINDETIVISDSPEKMSNEIVIIPDSPDSGPVVIDDLSSSPRPSTVIDLSSVEPPKLIDSSILADSPVKVNRISVGFQKICEENSRTTNIIDKTSAISNNDPSSKIRNKPTPHTVEKTSAGCQDSSTHVAMNTLTTSKEFPDPVSIMDNVGSTAVDVANTNCSANQAGTTENMSINLSIEVTDQSCQTEGVLGSENEVKGLVQNESVQTDEPINSQTTGKTAAPNLDKLAPEDSAECTNTSSSKSTSSNVQKPNKDNLNNISLEKGSIEDNSDEPLELQEDTCPKALSIQLKEGPLPKKQSNNSKLDKVIDISDDSAEEKENEHNEEDKDDDFHSVSSSISLVNNEECFENAEDGRENIVEAEIENIDGVGNIPKTIKLAYMKDTGINLDNLVKRKAKVVLRKDIHNFTKDYDIEGDIRKRKRNKQGKKNKSGKMSQDKKTPEDDSELEENEDSDTASSDLDLESDITFSLPTRTTSPDDSSTEGNLYPMDKDYIQTVGDTYAQIKMMGRKKIRLEGQGLPSTEKKAGRKAQKRKVDDDTSATSPPDEDRDLRSWKKSIILVYNRLASHKFASIFSKPITEYEAPGYHEIIRRPRDLTSIKKAIEIGNIKTTVEFQREMILMVQNAIIFNKNDTPYYKMAKEMGKDMLAEMEIMVQALGDGVPLLGELGLPRARSSKSTNDESPNKRKGSDEGRSTKRKRTSSS